MPEQQKDRVGTYIGLFIQVFNFLILMHAIEWMTHGMHKWSNKCMSQSIQSHATRRRKIAAKSVCVNKPYVRAVLVFHGLAEDTIVRLDWLVRTSWAL